MDTKQLDLAMLECQKDIKAIYANNKGNFGQYADYEQIMYHVRPVMLKHGLVLVHEPSDTFEAHWLKTIITHAESGQKTNCLMRVVPDKSGNGAYGAALTYAMRNSVRCLLALVTTDVDNVDSGSYQEAEPMKYKPTSDVISDDEYRMLTKELVGYPDSKAVQIMQHYQITSWRQLQKSVFLEVYNGIRSYHQKLATAGKPSSHV